MFRIEVKNDKEVNLAGRWDAAQAEKARVVFDELKGPCTVNFKELDYISSSGLGILLATQKRLNDAGTGLKLANLNNYISDVFRYAGFDAIFEIE